ncbi:helix-turn-helix domain-containing protein [Actinomycetes bacterium KLBMP 9797]
MEADLRGSLGTVRNAVTLLHLLADGAPYQHLTGLAERSGLSVPTVHRLLRSLSLAGLVEQDTHSARYGLGPELVRFSHRYLARLPVLAALSPYLPAVRDALGNSVYVALYLRGSVAYVDRVEGGDGVLYREPHRIVPALSTAPGRMLAARADDTGWEQAVARADEEQRRAAGQGRAAWRTADHLALPVPGHELIEVAVPVVDGSGRTAAALVASVGDEDLVAKAAVELTRATSAAGRMLGHA